MSSRTAQLWVSWRRIAPAPALAALALAAAGCGGSSPTTTEAGRTTAPAPSHDHVANAKPEKRHHDSAKPKDNGGGDPTASQCIAAWNGNGLSQGLAAVLLPAAQAAGPFPTDVGSIGGLCAFAVHASGLEGGGSVTYGVRQGANGQFEQGSVDAMKRTGHASLGRDGKLAPSG